MLTVRLEALKEKIKLFNKQLIIDNELLSFIEVPNYKDDNSVNNNWDTFNPDNYIEAIKEAALFEDGEGLPLHIINKYIDIDI